MLGRTNTGGGGGLNFKVIPNPQPSTAKENTIWVDTDKINNYYFSAEQPENMVDYDIWFQIGTSSAVAFSATKKNTVMVYPISAKQYVSGAWVDKTAKSYQGGKWAEWSIIVLSDGVDNTGGWVWYNAGSGPSATLQSDGSYKLSRPGGTPGYLFRTVNAFDLTNYSKLQFEILGTTAVDNMVGLSSPSTTSADAVIAGKSVGKTGVYEIDISTYSGPYAIGANLDYTDDYIVIANIKLMR